MAEVELTLKIDESALQEILDIYEDPSESYPESGVAQDFFEIHWDFISELAEAAKKRGMKSSWETDQEEESSDDA